MKPEEQVPKLETCIMLRDAGYPQYPGNPQLRSYWGWANTPVNDYKNGGVKEIIGYMWEVIHNDSYAFFGKYDYVSAPTLQELLEELARKNPCCAILRHNDTWRCVQNAHSGITIGFCHSNPAEAAALLYVKLHQKKQM